MFIEWHAKSLRESFMPISASFRDIGNKDDSLRDFCGVSMKLG
jgi:hypothetical protein